MRVMLAIWERRASSLLLGSFRGPLSRNWGTDWLFFSFLHEFRTRLAFGVHSAQNWGTLWFCRIKSRLKLKLVMPVLAAPVRSLNCQRWRCHYNSIDWWVACPCRIVETSYVDDGFTETGDQSCKSTTRSDADCWTTKGFCLVSDHLWILRTLPNRSSRRCNRPSKYGRTRTR